MEKYLKYFGFFSKLLFLSGIVVAVFMLFHITEMNSSYCYLWLWPLLYSFFVFLCFRSVKQMPKCHLLGTLLTAITFFTKYVVYPLYVCLAGASYSGMRQVAISIDDVQEATFMSVIELLVVCVFLSFYQLYCKKKLDAKTIRNNVDLRLIGSKEVYYVYLILAIAVYFVFGRELNVVQFLVIAVAREEGFVETEPTIYETLVKYIVSIGIALLTLIFYDKNKRKFRASGNKKKRYMNYSIIAAMFFTGCIIGESRGIQIALGLVMCLILINDYPQKFKSVFIGVGSVLVVVIMSISLFRTNSSNIFGADDTTYIEKAEKFQIYYGGPESIAQNIKVLEPHNLGLDQLAFDFLRSTFPFNLVLKSLGNTTSQIYNLDLYSGNTTHGQIVFSSSYGYLFGGYLSIPLTMILNIILILLASKYFYLAESYEIKYLSGYCLMRLNAACLVNTPSILGSVTQYICTFGLLFLVAKSVKNIKKRKII